MGKIEKKIFGLKSLSIVLRITACEESRRTTGRLVCRVEVAFRRCDKNIPPWPFSTVCVLLLLLCPPLPLLALSLPLIFLAPKHLYRTRSSLLSAWKSIFTKQKVAVVTATRITLCAHTLVSGLEKSAAIRPFATKKSLLASEKILLADSLATESCRLADRLATKLFSKRTTPMRTERDRGRSLADVFVGPRCNGSWPFGPVGRVCE